MLIGAAILLLCFVGPWQRPARYIAVIVAAIAVQPVIRRYWWTQL